MTSIDRVQLQTLSALKAIAILAFASMAAPCQSEEASVEAIKAAIEGAYVLEEWHRDGTILRPPLVEARSVLLNGLLMFIAHDRAQENNKTRVAGYAKYILEPGKFSYTYEGFTVVTQTAAGTSVSEKLPWEGLRTFAASIENNEVRFRATNGPQEWRFTADGLSYSDGKLMRVYRRVTEK
jgi:hypothetical protein